MNYSEDVTSSSAKQSLARVFVYRRKNGEGPLFGLSIPDRIIATRRRKSLKWDKNNKRNEQNPFERASERAIRPRSLRNRYHRYALAQDINQTNKACNWSFHMLLYDITRWCRKKSFPYPLSDSQKRNGEKPFSSWGNSKIDLCGGKGNLWERWAFVYAIGWKFLSLFVIYGPRYPGYIFTWSHLPCLKNRERKEKKIREWNLFSSDLNTT